jgi:hypothetical protein
VWPVTTHSVVLHAACRARPPRPVEAKLVARSTDNPLIETLMGSPEGQFGLVSFPMHAHRDVIFIPLPLVLIEAAPVIGKPFSKCGAFHFGPLSR